MGTKEVKLHVNDVTVPLDYFVQSFIDHVVGGMLVGLKGTGEIKGVDISITEDEVLINLNDNVLSLNLFASSIIRNTMVGMVSSLKGVEEIKKINISLRR